MKKEVGIDIDSDGKPDFHLDIKTIIVIVGGIISLTMTYSTLSAEIAKNTQEIEIAKTLPPTESHEVLDQKIIYIEDMLDKYDERLDKLEDKIYKR